MINIDILDIAYIKKLLAGVVTGDVTITKTSDGGLTFSANGGKSVVTFTNDEIRGIGIKSALVNDSGNLILTYTDNTTEDLGIVKYKSGNISIKDNTDYKFTLDLTNYDLDGNEQTVTTPNLKPPVISISENAANNDVNYKVDINTYNENGEVSSSITTPNMKPTEYTINPNSSNNYYSYKVDITKKDSSGTTTTTSQNIKGNAIWDGTDIIGDSMVFEVKADDGVNYSRINDLYINTDTSDIYKRTDIGNVNNTWVKIGNFKGIEGNDAYEVAVEEGFKGTRTEWLKSLMGESLGSQIVWEKPSIHDETTMLKVWYYYKVDTTKYGPGSAWLNRYDVPENKDYPPGKYAFYNGINYLCFETHGFTIPSLTGKDTVSFYVLHDERNSKCISHMVNKETGEDTEQGDWIEVTTSLTLPEGAELVTQAGEIIQYGNWVQTIYLGNSKDSAYECTISTGADISGFITSEEFKTTIGSDDLKTDRIDVKGAINEIFDLLKDNKDTVLNTNNKAAFEAINELYNKHYVDCYELIDSNLLTHCTNLGYKTLSTNFIYCENCTGVPDENNGYGYAMLIVSQDTHYRQLLFYNPENNKIYLNSIGDNEEKTDFGEWGVWNTELTSNDITQTINISSTATQVPSAKGIYDILSSSYVSSTVINGIDLNTVTNMGEYYSVNCTNKPINNDGYLKVYKCNDTHCLQEYSPITTPTKYMREQVKGSWTDWQKVCTTKTADTGVINITFNPNDNYEAVNNNCKYFIKNGICTIFLYIKCKTPNTRSITVGKVPKALNFYIVNTIVSTSDYTFLKCSVNAIGSLQINGGTEGTTYRGIITYPVE